VPGGVVLGGGGPGSKMRFEGRKLPALARRCRIPAFVLLFLIPLELAAADNLRLASNLDYSDHNKKQGPLITGDHLDDGIVDGKPSYVFFYFESCYNAKRQARRTVEMYNKYKGRFQFVVVDLDHHLSAAQKDLFEQYFFGYIPHTTILDAQGRPVFDYTGEADEVTVDGWMDYALRLSDDGDEPPPATSREVKPQP
jgi:hypothetical protein